MLKCPITTSAATVVARPNAVNAAADKGSVTVVYLRLVRARIHSVAVGFAVTVLWNCIRLGACGHWRRCVIVVLTGTSVASEVTNLVVMCCLS